MNKSQICLIAVLEFALVTPLAMAERNPVGEQNCASRARAIELAKLFTDNGVCAKLPEGTRAAIRNFTELQAKTTFRGFKREWLKNFDKNAEGSLGAKLEELRSRAFSQSLSEVKGSLGYLKLKTSIKNVDGLFEQLTALSLDGGTTPERVSFLEADLKTLATDPATREAQPWIAKITPGLANLRQILMCRLSDQERAERVATALKECPATNAAMPKLAAVYMMQTRVIMEEPSQASQEPAQAPGSNMAQ